MITVEIGAGEELMGKLTHELGRAGITTGVITSVIGAVDECCVSTMPRDDASKDILSGIFCAAGDVRDGRGSRREAAYLRNVRYRRRHCNRGSSPSGRGAALVCPHLHYAVLSDHDSPAAQAAWL